jgi:DNA helicase-4
LAVVHLRRRRKVRLSESHLEIEAEKITLDDVISVEVRRTILLRVFFGSRIRVSFSCRGAPCSQDFLLADNNAQLSAKKISQLVVARLEAKVTALELAVDQIERNKEAVYDSQKFVRKSLAERFSSEQRDDFFDQGTRLAPLITHTMLSPNFRAKAEAARLRLLSLAPFIEGNESRRNEHNKRYEAYWRVKESDFFKCVESSPLTDEQISAALTFEDATQVVAAAGSGKSSCIVAKIGFALKAGFFEDHEVLALAYNKKAATGLQKRLEKKLGDALARKIKVTSKTFHGFGLSTLLECYGEGYEPKVLKEDGDEEGRFIKSVITELLSQESEFQYALALWFSIYPYDDPQPVGISGDLDACAKRYEECCRDKLRIRRDAGKKPWEPTIPTFRKDVFVRSLEERAIVNWLITHEVEFEYERPDWSGAKRLGLGVHVSGKAKPYNPDFTYTYQETRPDGTTRSVRVVHEHFALDAAGHAPEWMGGERYERHAQQKRDMYLAWMAEKSDVAERVMFFETRSSQMRDGTLLDHLRTSLEKAGIKVCSLNANIQSLALEEFRKSSDLEQLIIDFVLRFKDSGMSEEIVRAEASRSANPYRSSLFLNVAFKVFDGYQQALKRAGKIDYADMVRDAVEAIETSRVKTPYRFILVDEFQDISRLRANLIKATLGQNCGTSILFCVGDDWQTINRFSGSDVSIFTSADTYFSRHTARLLLTRTFRCSQDIADVARKLVMRNTGQLDKPILAPASELQSCVRIIHHTDTAEGRRQILEEELTRFVSIASDMGLTCPTVQVLRRTQKDSTVPDGMDTEYLKELSTVYSGRLSLELFTLHGAKGLEADFVILVGLDSGFRGFPDERPREPLIDLVLPTLASTIEEDRRLMYVGMTRARHAVSVLGAGARPSEFLLQIEEMRETFSFIECIPSEEVRVACPRCGRGSLVQRQGTGAAKACSRSSACGFREGKASLPDLAIDTKFSFSKI